MKKLLLVGTFVALTAQSCGVTTTGPRGPIVDGPPAINVARQERVCRRAFAARVNMPPPRVRLVSRALRPNGRARFVMRGRGTRAVCVVNRRYRVISLRT